MMIDGEIYWCKMDKPQPKFRKQDGNEWSIECANIDLETKKKLKEAGVLGRVKNKMDEREDFIHFSISEYQRPFQINPLTGEKLLWDFDDGGLDVALEKGFEAKANDAPKIVDADGKPWDFKKNGLIGNKSKGTFKFNISGKNVYLVAVKVNEHVEYEGAGGGDWEDPDDWGEVTKPAPKKEKKLPGKTVLEELDDELPY